LFFKILKPLRAYLLAHKRRVARLIGLGGVLLVASVLLRSAPREVQVQLELGPSHREYVEVRVAYLQAGEELHGVAFSFPQGAPDRVNHRVRLPAGDFEVLTELLPLHGAAYASVGRIHAPSDGVVKIAVATPEPR
jgi:hypothetical protein